MVHRFLPFLAVIALGLTVPLQVGAQTPHTDYVGGKIANFGVIKQMLDRKIGGRMIGSEYDPQSFTYQFRYMRGTELVDVVVDARSGKILGLRESM